MGDESRQERNLRKESETPNEDGNETDPKDPGERELCGDIQARSWRQKQKENGSGPENCCNRSEKREKVHFVPRVGTISNESPNR